MQPFHRMEWAGYMIKKSLKWWTINSSLNPNHTFQMTPLTLKCEPLSESIALIYLYVLAFIIRSLYTHKTRNILYCFKILAHSLKKLFKTSWLSKMYITWYPSKIWFSVLLTTLLPRALFSYKLCTITLDHENTFCKKL